MIGDWSKLAQKSKHGYLCKAKTCDIEKTSSIFGLWPGQTTCHTDHVNNTDTLRLDFTLEPFKEDASLGNP